MLFASQPRDRIAASARRRRRRPQVESLEPRLALSTVLGSPPTGSAYHFGHPVQVAGHQAASRAVAQAGHGHQKSSSGHTLGGQRQSTSPHGRPTGRAGSVSAASVSSITATTTTFTNSSVAYAEGIQADGKIVVVGASNQNSGSGQFAIARYNPDLTLDTSFGIGGKRTTTITSKQESDAFAMAIDRSGTGNTGKIVVAGTSRATSYRGGNYNDFAVARYTSAGALDTSFGGGKGYVTTDTSSVATGNDAIYSVAIDGADRIITAGVASNGSYQVVTLARYTPQGSLDTSFNHGGAKPGVVKLDFGQAAEAESVVVDGQGNYLVAGTLNASSSPGGPTIPSNGVFLARYTASGVLDPSFGVGGVMSVSTLTGNADHFHAMALDTSGNIVVTGAVTPQVSGYASTLVARYTTAGALDATFGSGTGFVTAAPPAPSVGSLGYSVAIEPGTGAIVVGGYAYDNTFNSNQFFALTRFLSAGAVDTGFNDSGWLIYSFPNAGDGQIGRAVAISPYDGHYVLAGSLWPTGGSGPAYWGILNSQP